MAGFAMDYTYGAPSFSNQLQSFNNLNSLAQSSVLGTGAFNPTTPVVSSLGTVRNVTGSTVPSTVSSTVTGTGSLGTGSTGLGVGDWLNIGGTVLQGLASIGSYFNSRKALKQAQEQFDYQKMMSDKNWAAQVKNYNNTYLSKMKDAADLNGVSYSGSEYEDRYKNAALSE